MPLLVVCPFLYGHDILTLETDRQLTVAFMPRYALCASRGIVSSIMPISCHFRDCKADLGISLFMQAALQVGYIKYGEVPEFTFTFICKNSTISSLEKTSFKVQKCMCCRQRAGSNDGTMVLRRQRQEQAGS